MNANVEQELERLRERVERLEEGGGRGRALAPGELQELRTRAEQEGNERLLRALNNGLHMAHVPERAVLVDERRQ